MMLSTLLQCSIVIAMQIKLTVVVVVVVVWTTYRLSQNMGFHNTAMRWLNLEYVV